MLRKCVVGMLIVSLLFSVCSVLCVSAESTVMICVDGVNLLEDEDRTISCGKGTASYDETTATLTLKNAEITKYGHFNGRDSSIYATGVVVNLVLEGENTVKNVAWGNSSAVIACGSMVISGEGKLDISAGYSRYGISCNKLVVNNATVIMRDVENDAMVGIDATYLDTDGATIKIDGGGIGLDVQHNKLNNKSDFYINVKERCIEALWELVIDNTKIVAIAQSDQYDVINPKGAIYCSNLHFNILNGSDVTVSNKYRALESGMGIYIENSKINATSTEKSAIMADERITICNNSDVTANGKKYGIYSEDNDNKLIIQDSKVKSKGEIGIKSQGELIIEHSEVQSEGTTAALMAEDTTTGSTTKMLQMDSTCYEENGGKIHTTAAEKYYDADKHDYVKSKKSYFAGADGLPMKKVSVKIKNANYVKLNELVEKIKSLNKDDYVSFSGIEAKMAEIVYGLDVTHQDEIDQWIWELQMEYEALSLKEKETEEYEPTKTKVEKVKFDKKKIKIKVGKSATLKVKLTPAKVDKAEKKVKWSIDKKGKKIVKFVKKANKLTGKLSAKVKAIKKGKAKITCKTPSGKKAICTITVK